MQAPTHTDDDDQAARTAIEAAVLPFPARNSRVLWRDAELIAREDGATQIGPRHLRQALRLQYAIAAAVAEDPEWSRERSVLRRRFSAPHYAERAGA